MGHNLAVSSSKSYLELVSNLTAGVLQVPDLTLSVL